MRGPDQLIGLRQGVMFEDEVVDQALIEERKVVGGAYGPDGTAQLHSLGQIGEKILLELEEGRRVKSILLFRAGHDFVTKANPIGSGDLLLGNVPDNQVFIVSVVDIGVQRVTGTFPYGAKDNLPEPGQFAQGMRNIGREKADGAAVGNVPEGRPDAVDTAGILLSGEVVHRQESLFQIGNQRELESG